MKIIETLGGDAREMLLNLEKVVKKKTKDAPLDLFIEKDRWGRTKFILQEKVREIKESVGVELIEAVQGFSEARFEDNTIKNVALINKISRNNRVYTDKALNDIVDLADSVKVFADHKLENRSVRDLVGRISNPHKDDGTIRGDLEVLENHKDWVFAIAKQMPEVAGMSIRAMGSVSAERDSQGREKVESVSVLKSIDLVSEPATTKSLFENQ